MAMLSVMSHLICSSWKVTHEKSYHRYRLISPALKNIHKFEKIGHSDLVLFVCLGLVEKHFCMKRGGQRKKENWLPFKKMPHIDIIFHVITLWNMFIHVQDMTFQWLNLCPEGTSTDDNTRQQCWWCQCTRKLREGIIFLVIQPGKW